MSNDSSQSARLTSNPESIERCYNEFMPSGRCTLPCGHLGLCVSPDQAEIERLRAALKRIEAMDGCQDDGPSDISKIARTALDRVTDETKPPLCVHCGHDEAFHASFINTHAFTKGNP